MDAGDGEKGIPSSPSYVRRSTVVKWLHLVGYLQDKIKRVPDDPGQPEELVAGGAWLEIQSKT